MARFVLRASVLGLLGGLLAVGSGCYDQSLCEIVDEPLWCDANGPFSRPIPLLGEDIDGDGVPDAGDNCPNVVNPRQLNADGDGFGDVCDDTPDGDDPPPPQPPAVEPAAPEEADCFDRIDDDGDGLTDTDDPDCACSYACGDLDGSGGLVDANDLAVFSLCFDLAGPGGDCEATAFICSDFDADGQVDAVDFATFGLLFGLASANTVPHCP